MSDLNGTCVIAGASHAGSQLALQLRKEGWTGRIVLIGNEARLPYHRPPLSKAVLAGNKGLDSIQLRPESVYQSNDIELRRNVQVSAIDREKKCVVLSSPASVPDASGVLKERDDNNFDASSCQHHETLVYDRLALCIGASVIRIPMGDNLPGVFYLRQADDVARIREWLDQHIVAQAEADRGGHEKRIVVIGAGYIGLETAAVLASQGLRVTVLEMEDRVLERVASPELSDYVERLHRSHGVAVVTGVRVTGINGSGQVESVVCEDGSTWTADMVLIGTGIVPNTALAVEAGLAIENGIEVDESARSNDEHIFAAGDCTNHPSPLYGRRLRLESVQNANDQAKAAAAAIAGNEGVYDSLPWFWSDQYDIKIQTAGLHQDHDEILVRGDLENRDSEGFVIFYLKAGQLIAADCINRPRDFLACKALVREALQNGLAPDREKLVDQKCELKSLAAGSWS